MKAVYKSFIKNEIRLGYALSLIFFVLLLSGCAEDENDELSIEWKDNRAVGINIPEHLLNNTDVAQVKVRLEKSASNILGNYTIKRNTIVFEPLVPLTRGLRYEVYAQQTLVGSVSVPQANGSQTPMVVALYPSVDTLPENLLKIYVHFSAAMQENVALQHLALLNDQGDTIPNVFLNLQQELWNKERTTLTVWLDPGRIKRDLIPNQQMGNPLQKGARYTLSIAEKWKDVQGLPLQQSYKKQFVVGERDDASPQPKLWVIKEPVVNSKKALQIHFDEALDYFLLQETITVWDNKGNKISGSIKVADHQKAIEFMPGQNWKPGRYRLRVASYLEDLAGNNLRHPFDRDITKQQENDKDFVEREFVVKE